MTCHRDTISVRYILEVVNSFMTHSLVRTLRNERDLSQAFVAKKLGISRSSYVEFEKGARQLSFAEAMILADLFGVSLEEIASGVKENYEKYKEMILYAVKSFGDKGLPKTKLAKLLYLADFSWFFEYRKSMSGMRYRKIQYGPVPDKFFRALEELRDSGLLNINESEYKSGSIHKVCLGMGARNIDFSGVSEKEKKLMDAVIDKWRDARTNEIVTFTHHQKPYALSQVNEIIPYELIMEESRENVF